MSLQVELLEQSFQRVKPNADEFAASFYDNLFARHPNVKPLFAHTDMKKQQKKLLTALVMVVESLRKPEILGQVLKDMGSRHVSYGAIAEYYPAVGEALLTTFEEYLKENWTPEVKQAWLDAYNAITALMFEGAGYAPLPVQTQPPATSSAPIDKTPFTQKSPETPATPAASVTQTPVKPKPPGLQVELIETSFAKINPQAKEFAASFYDNLFARHPEVIPLFANTDMKKQQTKLLSSLVLVVEGIRRPEVLRQILKDLGSRHVSYGAIAEFYPAVGEALLTTFEEYLKEDWTPQVKQAWVDAYNAITSFMFEGAGYAPPPAQTQPPTTSSALINSAPSKPKSPGLQVELIETSFAKIKPQANEFAANFYDKLFETNPNLKPLFAGTDMKKQHKKLLTALVMVVESLRKPEVLAQVLKDMGARHVSYGAIPEYYPLIGEALLTTFEEYLKEDWTPQVKQAWVDAYNAITALMFEGAGYAPLPIQSDAVLIASAEVDLAAVPQASLDLGVQSIDNKLVLINTQTQEQIKRLTSILKEGITFKKVQDKLRYFQKQFVEWFWEVPTWVVASITVFIVMVLVLLSIQVPLLEKILGSADALSIMLALVLFIKEIPERRKQSHYQAWSTIDAAAGVQVSYARFMALQDLNRDGVPLSGLKLDGAKLENIDLAEAELPETDLHKSDLDGANLSRANLTRANLSFASLTRVNLSRANLSFANLANSNLAGSNFKNANLFGADLNNSRLTGVNFKGANLSAANLTGANLSGSNLKDANLTGANLEGAILPDPSTYQ